MSYTVEINQSAAFTILPVGQEIVLALSSELCVAQEQNVKFCFGIEIMQTGSNIQNIGTFKTTPNNEGVGMIDISNLIQNYVSADNIATEGSKFKDKGAHGKPIPIHIIDKYSRAANAVRKVIVEGYVEYTDSSGTVQQVGHTSTANFMAMNGYVKYSNLLKWTSTTETGDAFGIGFYLEDFAIQSSSTKKFLTNSPSTLYARNTDYGTLSYLSIQNLDETTHNDVEYIKITMYPEYDAGGTTIGNDDLERSTSNGAYAGSYVDANSVNYILYFGAFPANLRAWSDDFNTYLNNGTMQSYTIGAYDTTNILISELKTVNILCPNLKGFEQVRLTWLNQWGTWDYFTFNQKSVKTIATKGTTYQQLGGTWNGEVNDPFGYKGGKKSFRVNGTEKIKMNTDYLTEEHSEWFEELINSPEIYILKQWESPRQQGAVLAPFVVKSMSQYATPVRLTTTSFTKKTVANDKLIQYTFEVEKARNLRTQAI